MPNSIVVNRSALKEFLASIAVISGDLSNITAPPFVLAETSTVELPQYWADHPSLFIAPAKGNSAEERALLVLKWFLGSLKNQQYAGRKPEDGVKKPLNAFLGELFIGRWNSEDVGETVLISEQVSHHPPVTACYLSNEKFGVKAEGFTCQEITFNGNVSIKQKGYAVLHLSQHEEDYLIPVPNVKVKGILSGTPYPELTGTYSIIASTGYVAEVKFEGRGMIYGGTKNSFHARIYHIDRRSENVFLIDGQWSDVYTIRDATAKEIERVSVTQTHSIPITVLPTEEQDPWESRRAWADVIESLRRGDMKRVSESKNIIEEGQRRMRKSEQQGTVGEFERVFFRRVETDSTFEQLCKADPSSFTIDRAGGIWKANDDDAIRNAKKPYHGDLVPTGSTVVSSDQTRVSCVNEEPKAMSLNEQEREPKPMVLGKPYHEPDTAERRKAQSNAAVQETQAEHVNGRMAETISAISVEEFLRAKYSSSNR